MGPYRRVVRLPRPLLIAMVAAVCLSASPVLPAGRPARAAGPAATGCAPTWSRPVRLGDLPENLLEVSGFVTSARYPGVAWMIRDSDNPSSLFSFELVGDQPRWKEFDVKGVSNFDWEDISYTIGSDGRGRIWILENGREMGPKKLHEVIEPDPNGPPSLSVEATYDVEYPGNNINTEALFHAGGRFAFVTKTVQNRIFELPAELSSRDDNRLKAVGRLDVSSYLTAAATSADGRLLMTVATDDHVTIFEASPGASVGDFLDRRPAFRIDIPDRQFEAGDFFPYASCDIVLVSEDSSVWRLENGGTVNVPDGHRPVELFAPPLETGQPGPPPAPSRNGYWLVDGNGTVHAFGDARHHGQSPPVGGAHAVDLAATPSGGGYWVLHSSGQADAFGDAPALGGVAPGALQPGEGATSLTATLSGQGYWVFTDRGRALAFGDAGSFGDMSGVRLNGPVLDSIATPSGNGYYMVASDGGIFTFGDARFLGSMGQTPLNAPVRSLAPDPDGSGYWLVASDGGVFAFDAPFRGSMGAVRLNQPVVGIAGYGDGYVMVASDGGVFNFSSLPFAGSLGGEPGQHSIAGITPLR